MERLPHAQRSVTISTCALFPPTHQAPPTTRVIHFVVGRNTEVAKFPSTTPASEVKELFRCAAEAGPSDILKLYDEDGHLLNLSADLPSNSPTCRYTLEVVAANTHGMLLDEVGVDLAALEERVALLEKQLRTECDVLPPAIQELKQQVDGFRTKLETTEHLSWLGFYKQLPEPLSTEECRRLQYRRKSDSVRKRVKERFLQIGNTEISERVRHWLRMPTFDSRPWEDEEVLLLLQQMFLDLDLCSRFGIEMTTLRMFLYEIYKNYNDVPFHNFRHCFCVAQMMYTIIWATNLQPKIGDLEILILLVSCICHDLDHPGYNNIYQINAKTELALRYNDISPLENHHCSVAFRILENDDCNIFKTLSSDTFKQVREGMIRCILATDMARHNEILSQFKEATPEFDYSNKAHTNLLTMVLIKVADISNEARPMDVAEPWLDRLLQEFFKQSDAEKLEGLPVTPFMDREKITKPSSQCSFIGFVLLPLFEALGDLLEELQDLIVQPVRDALDYYRRLNEATKEERLHRKSVVAELLEHPALARASVGCPPHHHNFLHHPNSPDGSSGSDVGIVPKSVSNHSVRSRKSISFRSRSRSTEEDFEQSNDNIVVYSDEEQNLADLIEDNESGDSETATEVEVSEKTLKFKISTESNVSSAGRKSYPGSRKGSREKTQQLTCSEVAKAVQKEKERGKFTGALSFDSRSKRMSMDMNESFEVLRKFHGRSLDRGRCSGVSSPISGKSVDFLEDDEVTETVNKRSIRSPDCSSEIRTSISASSNVQLANDGPRRVYSPLEDASKQCTVIAQIDSNEKLPNNDAKSNNHTKTNVSNSASTVSANKTSEWCSGIMPRTINSVVKCISSDLDEIQVVERTIAQSEHSVVPASDAKVSPSNNHRSLMSRIRQFTDRFSLSLESKNTKLSPVLASKPKCKRQDVITHCCTKSGDDFESKKASTLPKINKRSSDSKKGWKTLITGSGKEITANSLTNIPSSKLDNHNPSVASTSGLGRSKTNAQYCQMVVDSTDQQQRQDNAISLIQRVRDADEEESNTLDKKTFINI